MTLWYKTHLRFDIKEVVKCQTIARKLRETYFDADVLETNEVMVIDTTIPKERFREFLDLFKGLISSIDTYNDDYIGYMVDNTNHFYFWYIHRNKLEITRWYVDRLFEWGNTYKVVEGE